MSPWLVKTDIWQLTVPHYMPPYLDVIMRKLLVLMIRIHV